MLENQFAGNDSLDQTCRLDSESLRFRSDGLEKPLVVFGFVNLFVQRLHGSIFACLRQTAQSPPSPASARRPPSRRSNLMRKTAP